MKNQTIKFVNAKGKTLFSLPQPFDLPVNLKLRSPMGETVIAFESQADVDKFKESLNANRPAPHHS